MTNDQAAPRPPIHMIDSEAETLSNLALGIEDRLPDVSAMLIEEISRATLHPRATIAPEVVTMNAEVSFIDEASGAERCVRIVFPREADIAAGRISILTPVGAGLIGLGMGQSIVWPDRDGHERRLTIVAVSQPPA
ncbi:nucleoside diphosphate kinase regulator [Novosphingobium sp. PS1R-30]|uniref:Nucleoside diphosphate kinase regulator n=1 Tax=Novosphingobium anseongense TaxID=3133436 RepID=A0ABU8RV30_9SPHN|nr:MAG: nucleoside diphosphate kinase regulator [Novosphingobium sp.]